MFPIILIGGLALLLLSQSQNQSSHAGAPDSGGGGAGPPHDEDKTCEDWLNALPVPLAKTVVDASKVGAAAVGAAADEIERQGFPEAAQCVRELQKAYAGTPDGTPTVCDAYLNDLPDEPPGHGLRSAARALLQTTTDPGALYALAGTIRMGGPQLEGAAECLEARAKQLQATGHAPLPGGGGAPPSGTPEPTGTIPLPGPPIQVPDLNLPTQALPGSGSSDNVPPTTNE